MTRLNAPLSRAANGSEMVSKGVYHSGVAEEDEPAMCGGGGEELPITLISS